MTLRQARERAGISAAEAARRLGVSRQAVSQWDTETKFPSTKRLAEVAELYGCTVWELMDGILETLENREEAKR